MGWDGMVMVMVMSIDGWGSQSGVGMEVLGWVPEEGGCNGGIAGFLVSTRSEV